MPLCPKCARRVPVTVPTCRCGHAFDAVADAAAPVEAPTLYPAGEHRQSPPMFVVAGVCGAVLLAMLYWINRDEATPLHSAATAAARPVTAMPPAAARSIERVPAVQPAS